MTIFHVIKYPVEDRIDWYVRIARTTDIPEIIREEFHIEASILIEEWVVNELQPFTNLIESLEKLYIRLLTDYNGVS